jgi:hypothetical protein
MRFFGFLVFLALSAYVAWPYYDLMRLERAVIYDDRALLSELVDVGQVRANIKRRFEHATGRASDPVLGWAKGGLQALNSEVIDRTVNQEWVRDTLLEQVDDTGHKGLFPGVSFAFLDAPTRLLVRFGAWGEGPVHLYLTLQDWRWRVTALYQ